MNSPHTTKLYELITKDQPVELVKGEVFQHTNDNLQMSVIKSGYIKRYMIRNDGSLGVQSIYGPGQFFPLTIAYKLFFDYEVYEGPETVHYEAMVNSVIHSVDNQTLMREVEKDISLYKDLFFISGRRLNSNIQRLENLSLLTYYNRVAHQLLYFAQTFGHTVKSTNIIDVPLTHQDIADVLSCTRETVSLCMSTLRKKKIIDNTAGKKIAILNMRRLQEEAYA